MKTLTFRDRLYPEFISRGYHSRFIMPVAEEVIGFDRLGVDVGCKKRAWAYPGSICVDSSFEDGYHARNLPFAGSLEYIFSSHCLEHVPEWRQVLKYWYSSLCDSGTLFLYLPHVDNEYWDTRFMPTNRHVNNLKPEIVEEEMKLAGFKEVFASQRDAAYSFCVYGTK
jgi:SAM-dependent methyltransferase